MMTEAMATEAIPQKTKSRWLIKLVAIVVCIGVCWFGYGYLMKIRREKFDLKHQENLKTIGLALHNYHEHYNCFPPAYVLKEDKYDSSSILEWDRRKWHSWRVLILPYLGEEAIALYQQYRFDEPWNGPHNKLLANKMPAVFASPAGTSPANCTPYTAVIGSRTVFPGPFSCQVRDITDGTSNTVMIMEYPESKINWMMPVDLSYSSAQKFFRKRIRSKKTDEEKKFFFLWADGRVKSFTPAPHLGGVFKGALTINSNVNGDAKFTKEQHTKYFHFERKQSISHQFGEPINADQLKGTTITPHLLAKITPQKNLVYCATFQMVWDECRTTQCNNKPIQLSGKPAMADALNKKPFPRESLSKECYFVKSGRNEEITAAMSKRFPTATPSLTKPQGQPYITFYSYLEKNMPFEEDFELLTKPISFQTGKETRKVKAFGLEPSVKNAKTGEEILKNQVKLLHYANANDFIIRLSTDGDQIDDIFLAKIPPGKTLAATLEQARSRIKKSKVPYDRFFIETVDTLAIPILELNIEKSFTDLVGNFISNKGAIQGWQVGVARQLIKLRLDEKGGVLISQAEYVVMSGYGDEEPKQPPPKEPRILVFDKPFLMFIQEPNAKEPYLVTWMTNTELMESAQ